MLVVYGAISTVVVFIGARLVQELRSLIAALPGWINQAIALVTQWTDGGGLEMLELSPEILAFLNWVLNEALTALSSLATRLVGSVATWTLDTAMNLPQMVLFVVLTVMGTFYMVARSRAHSRLFPPLDSPAVCQAADAAQRHGLSRASPARSRRR